MIFGSLRLGLSLKFAGKASKFEIGAKRRVCCVEFKRAKGSNNWLDLPENPKMQAGDKEAPVDHIYIYIHLVASFKYPRFGLYLRAND